MSTPRLPSESRSHGRARTTGTDAQPETKADKARKTHQARKHHKHHRHHHAGHHKAAAALGLTTDGFERNQGELTKEVTIVPEGAWVEPHRWGRSQHAHRLNGALAELALLGEDNGQKCTALELETVLLRVTQLFDDWGNNNPGEFARDGEAIRKGLLRFIDNVSGVPKGGSTAACCKAVKKYLKNFEGPPNSWGKRIKASFSNWLTNNDAHARHAPKQPEHMAPKFTGYDIDLKMAKKYYFSRVVYAEKVYQNEAETRDWLGLEMNRPDPKANHEENKAQAMKLAEEWFHGELEKLKRRG